MEQLRGSFSRADLPDACICSSGVDTRGQHFESLLLHRFGQANDEPILAEMPNTVE